VKLRRFRRLAPRWARYDIWNVGVATLDRPLADVHDLAIVFGGPERPASQVTWLPPQPTLRFFADPFPYRDKQGRRWLLVEDYGHRKRERGRIARVDPLNRASPVATAIVRERHISYPFAFADGEDVYCAPEMSQEEGCVLYRLQTDGSWKTAHHILRGVRLVDPTFLRHDGRWWLFGTAPKPLHNRVLHGYYADTLHGPWTPHARNPLKDDPSSARPAGRPFTIGERLYRPSQDCSETYGGAVNVMHVEALTPTDFRETLALRLEPDASWPYPDGLHHLVIDGTRVYFDAKRAHVDFFLPLRL
jgi:hypothetical protein